MVHQFATGQEMTTACCPISTIASSGVVARFVICKCYRRCKMCSCVAGSLASASTCAPLIGTVSLADVSFGCQCCNGNVIAQQCTWKYYNEQG